jgi:acetyl esterase/lipase
MSKSAVLPARSERQWLDVSSLELPTPTTVLGVAKMEDIIFSAPSGFRPLTLDIYAPELHWSNPGQSLPVVIWIHGGAFSMGSRKLLPNFLDQANFFKMLTDHGFLVASIDYRHSGESVWPAQIIDVRNAIRWIRKNSERLGADETRMATWGESAGGHLSTMAGILGDQASASDQPNEISAAVAAIVDWYGPTDFARMDDQAPANSAMSHDDPESPESLLLGVPVQLAQELVDSANPISYINDDMPPILIRHGRIDRFVPFGQSQLLAEALSEAGVEFVFHPTSDTDHVFEKYPNPEEFIHEAIAFLDEKFAKVKTDSNRTEVTNV